MSKAVRGSRSLVLYYTALSPCPSWQVLCSLQRRYCLTVVGEKSTPEATSVPSPTDSMSGSGRRSPSQQTFLPTRIPNSRSTPL